MASTDSRTSWTSKEHNDLAATVGGSINSDGSLIASAVTTALGGSQTYLAAPNGTDDTAVINAAITALPAGGVLVLQLGTYVYNSTTTLSLGKNVTLAGSGPGTVLKISGGSNGYVVASAATVTIRDLTLQRGSATPGRLLHVAAANCTVQNVVFDGNALAGNTLITNTGGDGLLVQGCVLSGITGMGIYLNGIVGVRIIGNRFVNFLGNGQQNPINVNTNVKHFEITANEILCASASTAIGINVQTASAADAITDGQIVGNYIESSNIQIQVQQTGSGTRPQKITVVGNTLKQLGGSNGGISIAGVDYGAINGNILDANGVSVPIGIECVNTTHVAITGNTVVGVYTQGIWLNGATYCTVVGNTVEGFADSTSGKGIYLYSTTIPCTDNVVSGNTVVLPSSGTAASVGIYVTSNNAAGHTDRNAITGNVVRGNAATGTQGIYLLLSFGTVDRNLVGMNIVLNCTTQISQSGDTNTLLSGATWNLVA